jgi:hypothetical protein
MNKVEKIKQECEEKLKEINDLKRENFYDWIYLNGMAYLMDAKDLQKDIGEHSQEVKSSCDKKIKETIIEYKKKEIELDTEEED